VTTLPPELAAAHAAIGRRKRARYLIDVDPSGRVDITIAGQTVSVAPSELVAAGLEGCTKSYGRRWTVALLRRLDYNQS
jgi:hypothetical protein